jgi:SAM-dependent methyltransferase
MHNLISTRVTQFAYFDQLLGGLAWKGRKVLDFGGNIGTFLVGAGDRVDHDDYWCIDLNREVIERGRQAYPRAHFVHYDRYSSQYNPHGTRHLPIPNCGLKFDIIVAFSVFTHTHQSEMFELVEQLRGMLSPAGVLAFTFTDARYDRSLSDPELPAGSDVRKMLQRNRVKNTSERFCCSRSAQERPQKPNQLSQPAAQIVLASQSKSLQMNGAFGNVYEDEERARAYATLQFPGTYYLAFRDLPALIRRYNHGSRALDFGCGTGRSTRFLRNLGLNVIGARAVARVHPPRLHRSLGQRGAGAAVPVSRVAVRPSRHPDQGARQAGALAVPEPARGERAAVLGEGGVSGHSRYFFMIS